MTTDVLLTDVIQVLDVVDCDLTLLNILVFRFDSSDCEQVHVKITDYDLENTIPMYDPRIHLGTPVVEKK